ncbi:MAG: 16S rRNA (guanine(527)-N(7))-methyltransferase RsmG [Pseudomonadota bacterium]
MQDIECLHDLVKAFHLSEQEQSLIQKYDELLLDWSAHTNLVARASLDQRWVRHYADSLQLWSHIPKGVEKLLDIGSGAGFPAILLAILGKTCSSDMTFTLVDSVGKKARFLESVVDALSLSKVTVAAQRVEVFHVKQNRYDLITARAVTALPKLLTLSAPLLEPKGTLLFPKGEKFQEDVDAASLLWNFSIESIQSMTHDKARILKLTNILPKP